MSRPRTPTNVLDARGAFDKNPNRRRVDPKSAGRLKPPGKHLDDERRVIWREIVKMVPEGVITQSDRLMLEIAVELTWEFRQSPLDFTAARLTRLEAILGKFGLSPSDRAKVAGPGGRKKAENPFSEF